MIIYNDTINTTLRPDTENAGAMEQDNTPSTTGDNIPEYWVTRVVRQMKGCSPSRIDSVIQANLPPRKINWSQRTDTLEIPGLEGRTPYTIDNLPDCYELGFFRGNKLLHPELTVKPQGFTAEQAYQTAQESLLGTIIIVCFALLSVIIHHTRPFLFQQAHDFFMTPKHGNKHTDDTITIGTGYMLLAKTILSTIAGILLLLYSQEHYNLFLCPLPYEILLIVYIGIIVLFLSAKWTLSCFINWIFFDKTSRQEWRLSYNFLLIQETNMLLALCAMATLLNLPLDVILFSLLATITVLKIILLYKTYVIFSFKLYGFLHLLSYLCALEIIPLLALWMISIGVTEYLTTTF